MSRPSKLAHYHYMSYAHSSLDAAKGWRESARHARKIGDRKAAKLFAKAAREAARAAREYAAQAEGRKSIHRRRHSKTRRSR